MYVVDLAVMIAVIAVHQEPPAHCQPPKHQGAGSRVALPFCSVTGRTGKVTWAWMFEFREPRTFGSGKDPVSGYIYIDQ